MSSQEHERKFLVDDLSILRGSTGVTITQTYLWASKGWSVRVRRTHIVGGADPNDEAPATLTLKGPRTGNSRAEYEVSIDIQHAATLISMSSSAEVQKVRHPVISEGYPWVIDVFRGRNSGLVVAELELNSVAELARVRRPWWAGKEVTNDDRYSNDNLAAHPWTTWQGP